MPKEPAYILARPAKAVFNGCHTQVILARLDIAYSNSVNIYGGMSRPQSSKAHCLETGIAAIVTDMYSGTLLEDI